MQKALLIAEKPSLMRSIEAVYKKHETEIPYQITFMAQRGHLVTLKLPSEIDEAQKRWCWENLPFHPEDHGGWQYKIIKEKKEGKNLTAGERLSAIKKELRGGNYDFIINAGDPDQEGELLVRIVLEQLGNTIPVKRFWTNDLTEKPVLEALKNLKDDDGDDFFRNLYSAAKGRQHSDYRFGMNLSEAASLKMNARVACGRVKTPILAIVCKREEEIRNFVPKTVYGVSASYIEDFTGILFDATEESENEEEKKTGTIWFDKKTDAEGLIKQLSHKAKVLRFEKKKTETTAPKLYKLATLQIDAGKMGYNDARVLQIIQGLYERELLSYPRTDCEYLSSSEDFIGILKAVMAVPSLAPYVKKISKNTIEKVRKTKKWINDKALQESGHSAIRPTTKSVDFNTLTKEEQDIYTLVCRRLIAIFLPPIVQNKTRMVTDIDGHTFKSTGKTLIDPGFSVLFGTKFTDMVIPEKKAGEIIDVKEFTIPEKTSTCPKRYTSPDIIAICENPAKFLNDVSLKSLGKRLKIGTPATRSGIIRQLIVRDKYLQEKKEKKTTYVIPTKDGEEIIKNLGSCDICKVDLTGMWEEKLEDVRTGKMTLEDLESGMRTHVESLIDDIKNKPMTTVSSAKRKNIIAIGTCPKCRKELIESEKGYSCRGYRDGCQIKLWKNKWNADFSKEDFFALIKGEKITKTVTIAGITGERDLEYDFTSYDIVPAGTSWKEAGRTKKGSIVEISESFIRCSDEKWQINRTICGASFSSEDIVALLQGQTITKTCTKEKEGKTDTWEQKLAWDDKTHQIGFVKDMGDQTEYQCPCCKKGKLGRKKYTSKEGNEEYLLLCPKCDFKVWPTSGTYRFTEKDIEELLTEGRTAPHDLVAKSGKSYQACFIVDKKKKQIGREFV